MPPLRVILLVIIAGLVLALALFLLTPSSTEDDSGAPGPNAHLAHEVAVSPSFDG